jgi:hypothetical protein
MFNHFFLACRQERQEATKNRAKRNATRNFYGNDMLQILIKVGNCLLLRFPLQNDAVASNHFVSRFDFYKIVFGGLSAC